MKLLFAQVLKFGIVGVIATIIDFGILTVLTEVFSVHYLTSAAVGFIISTIFNYLASMRYVFKSRFGPDEKNKELLIFVALSVFGLFLNQLLMWSFVDMLHIFYILAKVLATLVVMGWNFISRKLWIE
ncbi:sugar translocase [Jeotgalibaca sp. PTS2502]|uniref:GtrA family protein n=1 Tax=Jeotgalibaca sp. PTS2502 TaxID=1903686 RepID=UPI0009735847|nr:GtrA family protein [Jeotgalibaca sp. PTS2502]APZ49217.1 sugar translocase [Jeotgalibaca sp. PTS2502]